MGKSYTEKKSFGTRLEKRKSLSVLSDHHLMDSPAAGDNTESAGSKQQRQESKQKKRTAQGVKRANTGGANPANVKRSRQNLIKDKTQSSGQSQPQKKWNPRNVLQHLENSQDKENIDDGGTQPLEDHPQKDHQMSAQSESSKEKGIVVNSTDGATRESDVENEEEEDGEVHDEDDDFEEEEDEEATKRDDEFNQFLQDDAAFERELDEEEQAAPHFETSKDQMQLTLKALTNGKATCFALCKSMLEQSSEIKESKGEATNAVLCQFLKHQSKCLGTLTHMFGIAIDDILKPAANFIMDLGTRKQRKYCKNSDDASKWKRTDIIIQINNEQFPVGCYTRKEIQNLVLTFQDSGLWPEPKIGTFCLKDDIQRAMSNYFSLIDEPRKLGYIVSQFLRPQQHYQQWFIPKFNGKGGKTSENRQIICSRETNLFAEIVLYCGGSLLAQFPVDKDGKKPEKSLQLQFINIAREAVNQTGKTQQADHSTMRSYFTHIDDFVPILERDDIKSHLETFAAANDGSTKQSRNATSSFEPNTNTPTTSNPRAHFGSRVYQSPLISGHKTSGQVMQEQFAARAAMEKFLKNNKSPNGPSR